jgi:hypothetical protein
MRLRDRYMYLSDVFVKLGDGSIRLECRISRSIEESRHTRFPDIERAPGHILARNTL